MECRLLSTHVSEIGRAYTNTVTAYRRVFDESSVDPVASLSPVDIFSQLVKYTLFISLFYQLRF